MLKKNRKLIVCFLFCGLFLEIACRTITVAGQSTSDEVLIEYIEERCRRGQCGAEEAKLATKALKNQSEALKAQTKRQVELEERSYEAASSSGETVKWIIGGIGALCAIGLIGLLIGFLKGWLLKGGPLKLLKLFTR